MQNIDLFRIDGHALRVFVSVCETSSVSRTAELFELNQSTISHTMDKMRLALGDPLFVKAGRSITPSEKALAILPRVQQILADIEGLVTPERYDFSSDSRPVVIAIPTPALLEEMKSLEASLSQKAPGIRLEIRRLAPRNRIVEMLTQDECELAIAVSGYRYPSVLNHCAFGQEELVVFFDPSCRAPIRTIEDYANARHAVVNFGGGVKSEIEKALTLAGVKREVSLVAPTASMLGDLIKGTDMVATMPRRLGDHSYRGLSFMAPPFSAPDIVYELVWHRRYENSGRNMWLRELTLDARSPGFTPTVSNAKRNDENDTLD
jgi:LysR family transcriptional activator of mexEF-oprN operon